MLAARMLRLVSLAVSGLLVSVESAVAVDARKPIEVQPAQEIDFWQSAVVKPLLEEALSPPQKKADDEKVFYAPGVGHFDDFLPGAGDLSKDQPRGRHHRMTYHDGRITLCECVDDAGAIDALQLIRYDRRGAPRATGFYAADGTAIWYKYAQYDQFGRLAMLYTFDKEFELRFFETFTYRGEALDICRRDPERKVQMETIYENGDLYLVMDDVKRKVNVIDRKDSIRGPTKFGLKPYYPGYDKVAEARDGAK